MSAVVGNSERTDETAIRGARGWLDEEVRERMRVYSNGEETGGIHTDHYSYRGKV